jgi:hypothetical protein
MANNQSQPQLKKGDRVRLICDEEARPLQFIVRQVTGERASCRPIYRNGKSRERGGYLFRLTDITLMETRNG